MRFHAALALAACLAPAVAIFEDDAHHIDFHHALIGRPKHDATFFQKPYAGSKASLLYTISQNNTIGAVNPKDGTLVWRHVPPADARGQTSLRAGEDQDTVVSAVGDRVTAWSASDGRIVWDARTPGATVEDLEILEQEDGITNSDSKDPIVLLSGAEQAIKRLDGKTGRVKWTFEDASGDTPFQLSSSPSTIYYISLHAPMLGGSKLRVTSISPVTGKKIDQYTLSSDGEIQNRDDILFAGANTAAPLLAWTDKARSVLKINIIGTKGVTSITPPSGEPVQDIILHAPNRINSLAHFLVEYKTRKGQAAEVYHVDLKKNNIKKAYDLPGLFGRGTFSVSTSDANVYFTRITLREVTVTSSASDKILGKWEVKGIASLVGSWPVQAVSEVVVKGGSATAVRTALYFSNGQWVLIRNGEVAWERPEFLYGITSATWAELAEQEALAHELEVEGHQNVVSAYVHRVSRHVRDLEQLPAWLQSIPNRVLSSVIGKNDESAIDEVQHDHFGFHKLVIVATEQGRLAAIDVGSQGKPVWNVDLHDLAPGVTFTAPSVKAFRGYVEVKDPASPSAWYVNATTGGLLSPVDLKHESPVTTDKNIITFDLLDGKLKGFLNSAQGSAEPIWTFTPPSGERITSYVARPSVDPVASIGRVLGDRRVLYKYLNPNLVLVTSVIEASQSASIYLLDSASGQLLHAVSHKDVDVTRPIPATISENWFSYSFTLSSSATSTRGYQLVISDLYESSLPDDRGPLGASSNSSTVQPSDAKGDSNKPYVLSQTFQIPEEISHMSVTQTRQGITSRELLVTLPNSNAIVGIPRAIIDPRRPVGRDPTAQEASEGLVRYTPHLLFDPKWHLNHKYELVGIKNVIACESGLESTSLVFAYGHDVFGTRVAPSFAFDILGKGFNKIQMLVTVAALFVGVLFVAPLVRRKQINTLWQA
ncbi:DUF1620-domain-containing protein [Aaosphaeria arxii CBS 175.79]|uniref:ER membrane protein complex subunit 1 n=1 Tax=Aaosphaeria arxii CBS 175.79 TaxID=1450172 RepID=A0A6A5Y2J9_9PLEO|nr:DUF1620-domain-containing protein [Aaosphaeria arxii CBS 175.79]KAF2019762.1 DUF1620-domain-containing protein [Aaosphaeria arxii CBS 175.79]